METNAPAETRAAAANRRFPPFPLPPGASLPPYFGLLIIAGMILVLEVFNLTGIVPPVPAGLLLLVVAAASYLEGVRRGLIAATLVVTYEIYAFVQHGTTLLDPSWPPLRVAGLAFITYAVVGTVALFRRRLDALLRNERVLLEHADRERRRAERDRRDLAEALERVQSAQNALRMQASLLGAVGQSIIATDEAGRITWWNEPAARLFGRTWAEAATRPITELVPDPPSARESTLERIQRGASWTGEVEVGRPDGDPVTVVVSDSPIFGEAGRCAGMVRVVTDVSAQKEVERTQRLLADSGAALAASPDYESTIRTVARLCVPAFADGCAVDIVEADGMAWRLEAAHGDPGVEEKLRRSRRKHPVQLDSDDPVARVIRSGLPIVVNSVTEAQLAGFAKDGDHLETLRGMGLGSVIVVPLRATGRTLGAMAFWRGPRGRAFRGKDVALAQEIATRAGSAIQQARLFETALTASRAKSDFLAVMSHELRTPLTTIVGYTDLMLGGVPLHVPEQARTYIDRIRIAAGHLLGLIEQILVYARLETGREKTRPERVGVARILRESATLIESVADEKGVGFHVELPPAELTIETDATKFRQIVLNLLSNAVKFTDSGEVRLSAEADADAIRIAVKDTGIGIASEDLERVFEPFWQVDQSPTRRAGGAGLGLAVARRLATWLGGDVRVSSEQGRGSTFVLTLPLRWPGDIEPPGVVGEPTGIEAGTPGAAARESAIDPSAHRY